MLIKVGTKVAKKFDGYSGPIARSGVYQSIVQGCLANHRDNRDAHVYVEPRAIGVLKVLD